jgi:hypothetical protein
MNNSELDSKLKQLLASNRFSQTRKACLDALVGEEFRVSGVISGVRNTMGYLRSQRLRNGKTITVRLNDRNIDIAIRCVRIRVAPISADAVSQPITLSVAITGYDDIRQCLKADEFENPESIVGPSEMDSDVDMNHESKRALPQEDCERDLVDIFPPDDHAAQLLSEIEQMQQASQNLLAEVANDINKAQSTNVPLVIPELLGSANRKSYGVEPQAPLEPVEEGQPTITDNLTPPASNQTTLADTLTSSLKNEPGHIPKAIVVETNTLSKDEIKPELDDRATIPEEKHSDPVSALVSGKTEAAEQLPLAEHENRLADLHREILSEQQQAISSKVFGEIISLETGVPIKKVMQIQEELWRAVMSPSMFGKQRNIFNFFPFGDFRLRRHRDVIDMEFKSAPVRQLADHKAVEEYPHSNFDGSDVDSNHPPIATHAVRIAATVAPLVGLSPPLTYDVIFETLQLLLKVFGVGKRRIRFTDIGEFFPIVLRGTLQYHFRPYRPLIRFATWSFRAIVGLAEAQGEGQLAFEADHGVPDRSHARRVTNTESKKKPSIIWVTLIMAFIVYQAVQFFLN